MSVSLYAAVLFPPSLSLPSSPSSQHCPGGDHKIWGSLSCPSSHSSVFYLFRSTCKPAPGFGENFERGKKKVLGFESGKEMCEPENTHLVAELVRVRVL